MTVHFDLEQRWHVALGAFAVVDPQVSMTRWLALAEDYQQPGRPYHNLVHIAALMRLLDAHADHLDQPDVVALAVFYHDAVYDPRRSDNEACSAARAYRELAQFGIPAAVGARVSFLIAMTRHGTAGTPHGDNDLDYFLDFDLSVLGATPPVYDAYAAAIRQEYAHVPEPDFRAGRARVLGTFLASERIYRVAQLKDRWEAPARANIARELAALTAS